MSVEQEQQANEQNPMDEFAQRIAVESLGNIGVDVRSPSFHDARLAAEEAAKLAFYEATKQLLAYQVEKAAEAVNG